MLNKILNLFPANPKHVAPWTAFFALASFAIINTLNTPVKGVGIWVSLLAVCLAGLVFSVIRIVRQDSLRK